MNVKTSRMHRTAEKEKVIDIDLAELYAASCIFFAHDTFNISN